MKNRILKIGVILLTILAMTMANFVFVGKGLISYAVENITTNHANVEFEAYFKNNNGSKVTNLQKEENQGDTYLYLSIGVKNQGYFNGQIVLDNSNFVLKETNSEYVSKIEGNTIYLNQINVGATVELAVKVEPIKNESFEIGLLNMASKINLSGIYRDSTEKDIKINATREVTLEIIENNTNEDVATGMQIITNKIIEMNGQEKRVVQISYNMGLRQNNYPVKEINSSIAVPSIDGKQAEVTEVAYFNNMTAANYKYDGNNVEIALTNLANEQGKIRWKPEGIENVVITCVYPKDVQVEDIEFNAKQKVTLYNNKTLEAQSKVIVGAEELDSIIQIESKNSEESMYKGKINSKIARPYENVTSLKINYANAVTNVEVGEEPAQYVFEDQSQIEANIKYSKTVINKENFEKLFGTNGVITIYDQNGEIIGTVSNLSEADDAGNIVLSYEGREVNRIIVRTTKPVEEGTLKLKHTKIIQEGANDVSKAEALENNVTATYNLNEQKQEAKAVTKLENTVTEAKIQVNKETLSTVIANNVEIKASLLSNNEKYDLYREPQITIQLPEQVESVAINSIDLLYDNELTIKNYEVNGRNITIYLDGEQTQYNEDVVDGTTIVINATIIVNKKSATSDAEINMEYINEKQVTYASGEIGVTSRTIRIVAPKDVTAIYNIQGLGIETLGQEEKAQVMVEKSADSKELQGQIEIINNNENSIENITIVGDFPTNNNSNNMGIQVTSEISMQGVENAEIYYSENSNATVDLQNSENRWTKTIENGSKVTKFLIVIGQMSAQNSVQATYTFVIPENLEYNQIAKTGYTVKNTNSETKMTSEVKSTVIDMETGIGPEIQTKLVATKGGQAITGPVKNGEVIKYNIEVSNTGTEDIKDIVITAQIPEGTTMVEPEENYEYTGASYYNELESDTYESTIENLKVGEVVNRQYEVRINSNVEQGTIINNIAKVKYADATKETNSIQNVTTKGNIRITVKRITDRTVDLYTSGSVQYLAIVENISKETQENVEVKTNLPEGLNVERVMLITGMEKEDGKVYDVTQDEESEEEYSDEIIENVVDNAKTEQIEYSEQMNIGSIKPGENKVISYDMIISKVKNDEPIDFSVEVENNRETYKSNDWKDDVKKVDIGVNMTSNTNSEYVQSGNTIEYTITVQNKSNADIDNLNVMDNLPKQLTIEKITKNEEEVQIPKANTVEVPLSMEANSIATIEISTVVNYSEAREIAEPITNIANVEMFGENIATTASVNHIIEANPSNAGSQESNPNNNNNNNDNNIENPSIAKGNRTISGIAWFDGNANGVRDNGESLLSNIKVKLLNMQTNKFVRDENGEILEATTNENGIYVLDKIGNGKYIAIFEYNDGKYALTKYKVEGVSDMQNSDVVLNELLVEEERKKVASTDIIEINNNNIANIDIGFIDLQKFDLKLNKYINKILVQNAKGTTVREYDKENLAKIEIEGKYLNNSTVIIEYAIEVKNEGEVAGYVRKIADYASSDLKFSSELNKDWYQVGNVIYTDKLANEEIKAGETKTVLLTFSKTMTENNTGSIPNTAEIAECYNELGLQDLNSTPGNRQKAENDYGLAETIISVKTGVATYTGIVIVIVVLLGVVAVIVYIKKKNKTKEI